MKEPGLDHRHRDKDGEISRKHGNTEIKTLRKIYGEHFARGFPLNAKLSHILVDLDQPSRTKLVHDHEAGALEEKIKRHS